jgi:hypothetical protein
MDLPVMCDWRWPMIYSRPFFSCGPLLLILVLMFACLMGFMLLRFVR